MEQLDGKVAVITGGAGGIGLALAEAFLAAGAHVVVDDVATDDLAAVEATHEGIVAVTADVRSTASLEHLRDEALGSFGAVHVVCLNAGVAPTGDLVATSEDTWRWLLDVNVLGVANGIRVFAPLLVDQARAT